MGSAVKEIQKEIVSADTDIVNILRKAHTIAYKLQLDEFDQWIQNELNGYNDKNLVPKYRERKGQLKSNNPYHGWQSVVFGDSETEKLICTEKFSIPISEIISLCEGSGDYVQMILPGAIQKEINKACNDYIDLEMAVFFAKTSIKSIVEKVKDTVLDWTLKLEREGILGDGLDFTEEEKEKAKEVLHTVNYYGPINIVNGQSDSIQIVSGNESVVFNYCDAKDDIDRIKESIESDNIAVEKKETALDLLSEINEKIEKEGSPNRLKSLLNALREFLINAGGGIAAGVVLEVIQKLF